ncbi:MAG TPA: FtsX-like permease family protein [Streptosporangiaceae bacterium]|nr:FtsX-like permease family protein [Streptosporangiaceae bacterium]
MASVAVLAGGRMAERTRRVGLLKAVGSTPELVAAVLVAENLALAVVAAVAGLVIGWATAPLITNPGAGLIGTAGAPSITPTAIVLTLAVALAVALASTLVPAVKHRGHLRRDRRRTHLPCHRRKGPRRGQEPDR